MRTFEKHGDIKYVKSDDIAELLIKEGWGEVKPVEKKVEKVEPVKTKKKAKSKKVAKDDNSKNTD